VLVSCLVLDEIGNAVSQVGIASEYTAPMSDTADEMPIEAAQQPAASCVLCSATIPQGEPPRYVNHQQVCARCEEQVRAELAAEQTGTGHYPIALVAGLAGALVGAGVWAGIGIAMNVEVGYVAVLVGFLAGLGVKLGARNKRGAGLQAMAAGLAVVGLVAAKYIVVAHALVGLAAENGVALSYLDSSIVRSFPKILPDMLSPFDILWLILAIGAAYRIPAPSKIHVSDG
jgi:hypothetical protein